MHMIIFAIVHAENEEEALEYGRDVFHALVEKDTFDFLRTFDEPKTRNEYGDLAFAVTADSPAGKQCINTAMAKTREEFIKNLSTLRMALSASDDRLWEENPGNFRFYAKCLGEYRGVSTWIYDEHGLGLRDPKELETALSKDILTLWVVPGVAHS